MALSRPQTMQAAVLAELRRCINDGELRPGDVIRVDEEIYWLRALLEDRALRRALERATDDDRAAARDAFAAADRSLTRGDVNAFSEHARRFHTVILASCRMPRLLRLLEGLWDATETYRPASQLDQHGQAALQAEHRVMLDAFLAGDGRRLADATRQHRQHLLAAALLGMAADSSSSLP